jgi:hypothetical protein
MSYLDDNVGQHMRGALESSGRILIGHVYGEVGAELPSDGQAIMISRSGARHHYETDAKILER